MVQAHWVCPYCQFAQVVPVQKMFGKTVPVTIPDLAEGPVGFKISATGCSNPQCRKLTTSAILGNTRRTVDDAGKDIYVLSNKIAGGMVVPRGTSKPQPEYIPLQLREDYEQACAIKDLSPKAAATLVRRCLQGMIRHFCDIKDQRTLSGEINALRRLVDSGAAPSGVTADSVDAIDDVRGIGNIGAHMEKDVDHIVDVDENEAQALIELVEMLFDEWYVARKKREDRLQHIREIAVQKSGEREALPTSGYGDAAKADDGVQKIEAPGGSAPE